MATHRISLINWRTKPDEAAAGNVWTPALDEFGTNDFWDFLVVAFADSGTKIGLHGAVRIPKNYIGTAVIVATYTATATSGNIVYDFDYRAVAVADTESVDQATAQESVTVTTAAPAAALRAKEATMALTSGNLAIDDIFEWVFYRDGVNASDTMAATLLLLDLELQYADA